MARISWKNAILLTVVGVFISFIVFLMLQVFYASVMKNYLERTAEDNVFILIMLIVWGGLFIVLPVNITTSFLIVKGRKEYDKKEISIAILTASLLNLLFWTLFPFIFVRVTTPSLFEGLSVTQKIVLIPRTVAVYAVYELESPVYLWFYSLVTYSIIYAISLRIFVKKKWIPFWTKKEKSGKKGKKSKFEPSRDYPL